MLTMQRRPERCHPTALRSPIRRTWLSWSGDPARTCPEDVSLSTYANEGTKTVLTITRKSLTAALSTLSSHTEDQPQQQPPPQQQQDANPPLSTIQLPPEIIDYVDAARNPDIYTREFVELVQRGNQDLRGKREAFAGFRDVLAREMRGAMPECRGEVDRVVVATGGHSGTGDGDGSGGAESGGGGGGGADGVGVGTGL